MITKTSQLNSKIQKGESVKITFHNHNRNVTKFINSLFSKVLSQIDMHFLQSTVETVTREMIVNAVKANSKRAFFSIQSMDINNNAFYEKGMEDFKEYMLSNNEIIDKSLREMGLYVNLILKKDNSGIKVKVQNNTPILPQELERIQQRIQQAKKYNTFAEACVELSDDSEGEGFGILLSILFLRNSGLGEESFKILSNKMITQSEIFIPNKTKPIEVSSTIKNNILEEIQELPTFPDYIHELLEMCSNKDTTIKSLEKKISLDPSLTISVLKMSNSAGFITGKKIESLHEAITIIGLTNLKSILIAASSKKIFEDRYKSFKEIWDHCNKVAFYARQIAIKYKHIKYIDKVFTGGILHDIGKIILLAISPELSEKISAISVKKEIRTSTVIEEVSIGISHSKIGKLIAEKWNMPEYLVNIIENHHSPYNSKEEYEIITNIVCLANRMCNIEDRKFHFEYLDDKTLELFKIPEKSDFEDLHNYCKNLYENQLAIKQ